MKRAQTTTEYLILLSVIILIVLIAVGSIIDFPSLLEQVGSRSDSAYWQYSDIRVLSHVQNDTHFRMQVQNAFYEPINITKIILDSEEFDTSYYLLAGERVGINLEKENYLEPGTQYSYTVDFEFTQGSANLTYPGAVPLVGDVSDN